MQEITLGFKGYFYEDEKSLTDIRWKSWIYVIYNSKNCPGSFHINQLLYIWQADDIYDRLQEHAWEDKIWQWRTYKWWDSLKFAYTEYDWDIDMLENALVYNTQAHYNKNLKDNFNHPSIKINTYLPDCDCEIFWFERNFTVLKTDWSDLSKAKINLDVLREM